MATAGLVEALNLRENSLPNLVQDDIFLNYVNTIRTARILIHSDNNIRQLLLHHEISASIRKIRLYVPQSECSGHILRA